MNIKDILNDVIKEKQKELDIMNVLKEQFLEMGLVQDTNRKYFFMLPDYIKKYLDLNDSYFFEILFDRIMIFKNGISEYETIFSVYYNNIPKIISVLCADIYDILYAQEYLGSAVEE